MENKTEEPGSQDNVESIDIEENIVTGEVTATSTHVVKGKDGTTETIETKEKFLNG